jgi:preprotein translocase subunit SecD
MKRIAVYSVVLMAAGVVLSAFDSRQPASSPKSQSLPAGNPRKRLTFEASSLSGTGVVGQSQLESALEIVRKRLEVMELMSATAELSATSTLIVTIPATADDVEVSAILIQRGFIEFLDASSNPPATGVYLVTEPGGPNPDEKSVDTPGAIYPVVLTSDDLQIGGAEVSTRSGMADLQLTTTDEGKIKLADYTHTHLDSSMPIVLDKYVLVSSVIRGEISGGVLGMAGLQEAEIKKVLASVNSGVLPVRLTLTGVGVVSAN